MLGVELLVVLSMGSAKPWYSHSYRGSTMLFAVWYLDSDTHFVNCEFRVPKDTCLRESGF